VDIACWAYEEEAEWLEDCAATLQTRSNQKQDTVGKYDVLAIRLFVTCALEPKGNPNILPT